MKRIRIEKYKGETIEALFSPAIYSPSRYGLSEDLKGRNVKIAIIDSGCPQHKDIIVRGEKVTFCDTDKNLYDKTGHSTMVSGIIRSNNKKAIVGLAPHAELYFAKIIDEFGKCTFSSMVAAVLWAIVKKVDIILMALGTLYDYSILHNAIQKAADRGICVISASNNLIRENKFIVDFPSKYKEVFSVTSSSGDKNKDKILRASVDFILPSEALYTTFLNNKYTKVNGSSISSAIVCGLVALLLEKNKKENNMSNNMSNNIHKDIHSELLKILK